MTISTKVGNVWTGVSQPFVKVGGVWKPAVAGFVKSGGQWKQVFSGDNEPPSPPVISLQNVGNKYVAVSVKMPQATNQLDIKRIRVLAIVGGTSYPDNPLSAGFYAQPNVAGGNEAWSDFFFNDHGEGIDGTLFDTGRETQNFATKLFAPTYKTGNTLRANTRYNFAAWAQDVAGNWSSLKAVANLTSAKSTAAATDKDYTRTAVLLPEFVGTRAGAALTEGEGYVGSGPDRRAFFDYGNQVVNLIASGSVITDAYVRISRKGVDHGQPTAKQFAGWHGADDAGQLEQGGMLNHASDTLNAISKGGVVNKDLRPIWLNGLAAYFQGFELYESPSDTIGSQAVYNSQAEDPNQGALTLRWKD